MKKISLGHKVVFSFMALLMAFGVAMGPSQAFAAPYDGTQATTQAANTSDTTATPKEICERYKAQVIARLTHEIADTQKKIDYLNYRIAHTDNDKIKQYLMLELHRQETKMAQLRDSLARVQQYNCDTRH